MDLDGTFNPWENMRAKALRFARGVWGNAAVSADQQVIWFGLTFDYTQLLNQVRLRFPANRPDAAGDTHAILKELVQSYFNGLCSRSMLHANVCVLFIGHADLFNRFERLLFMYDGRQETRHQIREWRNSLRNDVMLEIDAVLKDYLSAIGKLRRVPTPERLNGRNLNFVKETCFPDRNNQVHVEVMLHLVIDPASVRDQVLAVLEQKQMQFWRLDRFLARYFGRIASGGI